MFSKKRIVSLVSGAILACATFVSPAFAADPALLCHTILTGAQDHMQCLSISDLSNHWSIRGVLRARSTSTTTACGTSTPSLKLQFGFGGTNTIDGSNDYSYMRSWNNGNGTTGSTQATATSGIIMGTVTSAASGCDSDGWATFQFSMPGALDSVDDKTVFGSGIQDIAHASTGQQWFHYFAGMVHNSGGKITDVYVTLADGSNFATSSFMDLYAE